MAGESNEETMATIMTAGFDCIVKAFQLSDGSIVNCYIYDTAGQERFRSINVSYYRKADAILLVYDISNKKSFNILKEYFIKEIKDNCKEDVIILLLGNKSDKEDERQVSKEEGIALALKEKYEFKESSCLKNKNVAGAFELIIERLNFQNHKKENKHIRKSTTTFSKSKTEFFPNININEIEDKIKRTDSFGKDKKRKKTITLDKKKSTKDKKRKKCC